MPHNKERQIETRRTEHHRATEIIDWMSSKKYSSQDYNIPELINETMVRITRKDPKLHHGLKFSEQIIMSLEDFNLIDNYIEGELPNLDFDKNKANKLIRAMTIINRARRKIPALNED